jgi:hypothetical protein
MKKWLLKKSALGVDRFSTSDSTIVENGPSRFPPHNVECKKGEA